MNRTKDDQFSLITHAPYLAMLAPTVSLNKSLAGSGVLAAMEHGSFGYIRVVPDPAGGVIFGALTRYSIMMVRDPEGRVDKPANLRVPMGFLKACRRPKFIRLMSENMEKYGTPDATAGWAVPSVVQIFHAGGLIAGRDAPPELHKGATLYSVRAETEERYYGAAKINIELGKDSATILERWQEAYNAPAEVNEKPYITGMGARLVAKTIQAHSREFWEDMHLWEQDTANLFKQEHPVFRYRTKGDVKAVICIAPGKIEKVEESAEGEEV